MFVLNQLEHIALAGAALLVIAAMFSVQLARRRERRRHSPRLWW
jgi:hypothetical protein